MLAKSGNVDYETTFQDSSSEVWIYTENQTLESPNRNIKVICIDKCYLKDILKDIYKRGIGSLLIEAGPRITSKFLQTDFINQLIIYYAPKIIGGSGKINSIKLRILLI